MNEWQDRAIARLEKEKDEGARVNRYAGAMAGAVSKQLMNFCRQDEEFAQAVVQGKDFKACMAAVTNGIGSSISDLNAYQKAVAFYFPGAKVKMQMSVDLVGDANGEEPQTEKKGMILDLTDFL